jgi:shikimate dehydrogenase
MSAGKITEHALKAGVVGRPITHSLSPLLHNTWINAAELNAAYSPYSPEPQEFKAFVDSLRGGVIRGLNVTLPFKEAALALADVASPLARAAGAANLLLFQGDGRIEARNTDGEGLLYAFARQAPDIDLAARPIAVIGAGGAARGAVATLIQAGVPDIRVINRTQPRAEMLAAAFPITTAWALDQLGPALDGVGVIINATSAEIVGEALALDFSGAADGAVAMDMLYRPLETRFLFNAKAQGLRTVDGLDMLIGQAIPSFEAFFGVEPPGSVDARALLLAALEPR